MYPVVFIDAIVVKIREGQVANRPIYIAIGVTVDGERDILGLWAGEGGEGAKYWAHVLTEIKNRGTQDVCIVVCDGLKGLPEAVTVDVARGDRADMRRASNSREFPLRLEAGLAGVGQGPQADLHRGDGSGGARAFGRDGGAVGGEVSGHHRPVGERVGGNRDLTSANAGPTPVTPHNPVLYIMDTHVCTIAAGHVDGHRVGQSGEPVAHHDAHIKGAPVLDLGQHVRPVFGGSAHVRANVCKVMAKVSRVG